MPETEESRSIPSAAESKTRPKYKIGRRTLQFTSSGERVKLRVATPGSSSFENPLSGRVTTGGRKPLSGDVRPKIQIKSLRRP